MHSEDVQWFVGCEGLIQRNIKKEKKEKKMTEAEAAIGRERISSCLSTNSFLGFIDWVHSPEVQAYPKEKKKNPIEVIKKKQNPTK